MAVLQKKTKVMLCTPSGRLENEVFSFGENEEECVDSFDYLGVVFSHKGTFTECKQMHSRSLVAI
jgi:hypothetical protein